MEIGGLKGWQWMIVLLLAAINYPQDAGVWGFIGAVVGAWVIVALTQDFVGWVNNRSTTETAP